MSHSIQARALPLAERSLSRRDEDAHGCIQMCLARHYSQPASRDSSIRLERLGERAVPSCFTLVATLNQCAFLPPSRTHLSSRTSVHCGASILSFSKVGARPLSWQSAFFARFLRFGCFHFKCPCRVFGFAGQRSSDMDV